MAEVVGLVASVIQLILFSQTIYDRVEDYRSAVGSLPGACRHIVNRLGTLKDALKRIQLAIETGALDGSSREALRPTMHGCAEQIKQLNEIIKKAVPPPEASKAMCTWKALGSYRYDGKVEKIRSEIEQYIQVLGFHSTVLSANYVRLEARPRPQPANTAPYRRDPDFVDRRSLTTLIEIKCQEPAARVALVGLGGVGKTQLAVEYAYRLREMAPDTWVFWVSAETSEKFEQTFQAIAKKAQISAFDKDDPDKLKVISNWLADEVNGRWLMIVDNADDLDVLLPAAPPAGKAKSNNLATTSRPNEDLLALLPQTANGSYLITSRNQTVPHRMSVDPKDMIQIKEMDQAEAVELLKKKLVEQPEDNDAKALVEAVECMPLSITQAAGFINLNRPRETIQKYLKRLHQGDKDRTTLLEEDIYDARRDGKRSNSIIITWHISFERIRQIRPSAARLLSLMSLFNREDIPESLLTGKYSADTVIHRKKWKLRRTQAKFQDAEICDFDKDWSMLNDYFLINTNVDSEHFSMHALVQFSTQKWLGLQGELKPWAEKHVVLMKMSYPRPDPDNLEYCTAVLPHATAAIRRLPDHWPVQEETLRAWAYLLHNVAEFCKSVGNHETCTVMNRAAFLVLKGRLGEKHPDTLESAHQLGRALVRQKQYGEAETLLRQTYEMRKEILGPEHPDTLLSMDSLGCAVQAQGRYHEGHALHKQVLEIRERLTADDPDKAMYHLSLAVFGLTMQGNHKEAEPILRRLIERKKKVHGEFDQALWEEQNLLGTNLQMQGRYREAGRIYRQTLEAKEQNPEENSETKEMGLAPHLLNLAKSLVKQKRFQEAEPLLRRAVKSYELKDGEPEWSRFEATLNLAEALLHQGKLEEAEHRARGLVEESQKAEGKEDEETLWALRTLADILQKQKRNEEASELYQRAYTGFNENYANSPDAHEFLDYTLRQRTKLQPNSTEQRLQALMQLHVPDSDPRLNPKEKGSTSEETVAAASRIACLA